LQIGVPQSLPADGVETPARVDSHPWAVVFDWTPNGGILWLRIPRRYQCRTIVDLS